MNLLTPGIRAEVTMILGDNGQIGIYHSKLAPEDNATEVYGVLLMRWLSMLSGLGVSLNFETETGMVVPLVRPQEVKPQ
jgi:hypothetical protein